MHHIVNWWWCFGGGFSHVYDHLKLCIHCLTIHIQCISLVICAHTLICTCKYTKEDQRVYIQFSFRWLLLGKRVTVGQEQLTGTFNFYLILHERFICEFLMFFKWAVLKNKDNKLDKQTPKLFGDGSIMSTLFVSSNRVLLP